MKKISFTILFLILTINVFSQKRPNIIVILSDDVGFEEYGAYNVVNVDGTSNTPAIDQLGKQGVIFQTAYAQSICGPSRSMFYSGTYAAHTGAYDNNIAMKREGQNKDSFPNFIKVLHDAGYKTCVSGKWHNMIGGMLGEDDELLGVDEYILYNRNPKTVKKITGVTLTPDENWEVASISKEQILSRYWKPAYVKNGEFMETTMEDYGPDILSDYICDFIDENAKSEQPFLAFYPMVLAHGAHCVTPLDVNNEVKPSNVHYRKSTKEGMKVFRNQVKYADMMVQKVIDKVKEAGIEENTIIIYTSDNGTASSAKSKGVEYGVHIPFVVAGAGIKQRGMTNELVDFTDVLPTLAAFAGAEIPSKYTIDGTDISPFLTGKSNHTKDVIYAQPGVCSLVRTKDYLLEAVSPLYGYPNGRLYKTNGSFDGKGYENITHNPKFKKEKEKMMELLSKVQSQLPTSFEDQLWQTKDMKKGLKLFTKPKTKEKHLSLPKDYQFYDPSF